MTRSLRSSILVLLCALALGACGGEAPVASEQQGLCRDGSTPGCTPCQNSSCGADGQPVCPPGTSGSIACHSCTGDTVKSCVVAECQAPLVSCLGGACFKFYCLAPDLCEYCTHNAIGCVCDVGQPD